MILIGGSFGGARAVQAVLRNLPPQFSPATVVCLHRHRDSDSVLRAQLQSHCAIAVVDLLDKQLIAGHCVYLVPPDYHALVEHGYFSLSVDEPVHYARPSLDVLFESAAEVLGSSVVCVVLTGSGEDGARGAARVEQCGGTVIIQDPASAERREMPDAALRATRAARVLPLDRIGATLVELSGAKES